MISNGVMSSSSEEVLCLYFLFGGCYGDVEEDEYTLVYHIGLSHFFRSIRSVYTYFVSRLYHKKYPQFI